MEKRTDNGIFITFEGIDGCGKTTQMELAATHLYRLGFDVKTSREPGGTELAERIRAVLLDSSLAGHITPTAELLLYLASRHQHSSEVIIPHLEKGGVVLCDRYADSSTAYQGAGRELGIEFVENLNSLVIPRWPDLTIVIDIPVEIALSRMKGRLMDRLEIEGSAFLEKVRNGYLEIAKRHPERVVVIHSDREAEKTSKDVIESIDSFLVKRNLR